MAANPKTKNSNAGTIVSEEEYREFVAVFHDIVRDLTKDERQNDIPEVMDRCRKVMNYSSLGGKQSCGLTFVNTYKLLEAPDKLTPEIMRLCYILGWCIEILLASYTLSDDIIDHAEVRRQTTCWYKIDGIGLSAFNDSLLLENTVFRILKLYISDQPYYLHAVELFHELNLGTLVGLTIDTMTLKDGRPDFSLFTKKRHFMVSKYKTALFLKFPVSLAMCLVGKYDSEMHRQALPIMLEMGRLYQVQDDFLDYLSNSDIAHKVSSDIADGKCTWFIATALEKANPKQQEILKANYARPEPEAIQTVRDLYDELGIRKMFAVYEEEKYNLIRSDIQQTSTDVLKDILNKMLDIIYKRSY